MKKRKNRSSSLKKLKDTNIIRIFLIILASFLSSIFIYSLYSISPSLNIGSSIKIDPISDNPIVAEYFIAPNGSDNNSGTIQEPFATIEKARDIIRDKNRQMSGNILVYLRGGIYQLVNPLSFDERDSGSNGFNVIYKAYDKEIPLISGGKKIDGWQLVNGKSYWKTKINNSKNFRQLYIDGHRRQRARTNEKLVGLDWYGSKEGSGITIKSDLIPSILNPKKTQFHFQSDWQDYYLPVQDIREIDNENFKQLPICALSNPICKSLGKIIPSFTEQKGILLSQPYFKEARGYVTHNIIYDKPFYLENDLSLLDKAGEWYFDSDSSELFYWPIASEKINELNAVIPSLFQILLVQGKSSDKKVTNLHFEGLTFAYAGNWEKLDEEGWFGTQAQAIVRPQIEFGMTPATIVVNMAKDITFTGNIIEHMGLVGMSLTSGVNQVKIQGNIIRDISDSAITVGSIRHGEIKAGDEITQNNLIQNNILHHAGQDFFGAPGIQAYWTKDITIDHNEVSDLPYTGIAVGWGWDYIPSPPTSLNNKITNNRIERVMQENRDGAGIYTLGSQPNSIITGNYISNSKNDFGGIYLDQGSAHFTVENNVVLNVKSWILLNLKKPDISYHNRILNNWTNVISSPTDQMRNAKKSQDTSFSNTNFMLGNTLSQQAKEIIDKSGIEKEYRSSIN